MESVAPFERHRNAAKFFDPLSFMRREIDRVFDLASSNGWAGALDKNLPALRMDVAETDKEILVTAELPGVDREDVEVSLAPGLLIIKGEKRGERDEKKPTTRSLNARSAPSNAASPCPTPPTPLRSKPSSTKAC
jgi:HSP20 family protein